MTFIMCLTSLSSSLLLLSCILQQQQRMPGRIELAPDLGPYNESEIIKYSSLALGGVLIYD
jgi:hypothetical protein